MKSASSVRALVRVAVNGASALSAMLRLGVYLFAASLLSTVIFLRAVRADVERLLWEGGASLMEHPDAALGIRRQLELNGTLISFGTQTVEASLASILEHYESLCESRDAQLGEELTNLLSAHSAAPQTQSRLRAVTTTTARNAEAGYVACLDLGPRPRDLYALADRFARFAATGNLREAGVLRYVFARRTSADSGPRTLVLTISAESDLNLRQMIPEGHSDAAGRDLAGVPRPLKSQRLLSAWEVDQPSGLALYRVSATAPARLESFYRTELSQLGWQIIERNPGEAIEIDGVRMLSAERHGRVITILSRPDEQGEVLLTILASEPTR